MNKDYLDKIENKRFSNQTYDFILEAMIYAIDYCKKSRSQKVVSARMLGLLLCKYAKEHFGTMAETVLEHMEVTNGQSLKEVLEDLVEAKIVYSNNIESISSRLNENQNYLQLVKLTESEWKKSLENVSFD